MEIYKDYIDSVIIYLMGYVNETNNSLRLYRNNIYEIINNPRENNILNFKYDICPDQIKPKSDDTIRNHINELIRDNYIEEGKKIITKGAPAIELMLTEKGFASYRDIKLLLPVLRILPSINEYYFGCNECDTKTKKTCYESHKNDLRMVLNEQYNMNTKKINEIINHFYDLQSIQELTFWLTMNKASTKILKHNFPFIEI